MTINTLLVIRIVISATFKSFNQYIKQWHRQQSVYIKCSWNKCSSFRLLWGAIKSLKVCQPTSVLKCQTPVLRIYPVSGLSHAGYPWSPLLLVLLVPFWVHAMRPAFLPLLELAFFFNHIKDGLWLFPNFRDILTTPHSCTFILGNKKKSQGTTAMSLVPKKCFYLSMSNQSANFVEVSHMFSPPLECTGIFHMKGLTWQLPLKWYFTETLSVFMHTTSGVIIWMFTIFNRNFPTFESRK